MKKSFTVNSLALLLFATSIHMTRCDATNNQPSFYQVVITWFFGNSYQPHNNSDQAPVDVTAQDYINQFRCDLNGPATHQNRKPVIPWHEVDEMEAVIREELRNINLRDRDMANQIIRSVLLNQVKTETVLDLNQLRQEGLYISPEEYQSIPNSHECNILARLNRAPHLNGESIAQYFGENRKNETKKAVLKKYNAFH